MIDLDINSIPIEEVPRLILALSARLVAEPALAPAEASPGDDDDHRLLTTREAAEMLGHSVKWVYRHAKSLPFARRIGSRDYRFELKGLRAWQRVNGCAERRAARDESRTPRARRRQCGLTARRSNG